MARRSTTTIDPTAATAGDPPLEELPDFDDVAPVLGHEQQLANLDERDDRLNGNGVRPSERCAEPSPANIGCTLKSGHSYLHSWQSLAKTENDSLAESDAEQALLPGTPEPEVTDYTVPTEASFGGKDFIAAPGLSAIAGRLIESHPTELSLLDNIEIRYLWKRRGGSSGGNPKLGALQRPGGLLRYFTGGVTFVAWLAADNCRELMLDTAKIEANLFHQLLHAELNPDDDDGWRIRGHSFEGFVEELDRFGAWSADLREAAAHMQLLPLDQALAETDSDDSDDGEESE